MAEGGSVNGIWKWIAAILVAVMLAGAPAIIQAIKAPSQEEVDIIRERQLQVLIRLESIEARLVQVQAELQRHEEETRR